MYKPYVHGLPMTGSIVNDFYINVSSVNKVPSNIYMIGSHMHLSKVTGSL